MVIVSSGKYDPLNSRVNRQQRAYFFPVCNMISAAVLNSLSVATIYSIFSSIMETLNYSGIWSHFRLPGDTPETFKAVCKQCDIGVPCSRYVTEFEINMSIENNR